MPVVVCIYYHSAFVTQAHLPCRHRFSERECKTMVPEIASIPQQQSNYFSILLPTPPGGSLACCNSTAPSCCCIHARTAGTLHAQNGVRLNCHLLPACFPHSHPLGSAIGSLRFHWLSVQLNWLVTSLMSHYALRNRLYRCVYVHVHFGSWHNLALRTCCCTRAFKTKISQCHSFPKQAMHMMIMRVKYGQGSHATVYYARAFFRHLKAVLCHYAKGYRFHKIYEAMQLQMH